MQFATDDRVILMKAVQTGATRLLLKDPIDICPSWIRHYIYNTTTVRIMTTTLMLKGILGFGLYRKNVPTMVMYIIESPINVTILFNGIHI